MTYTDIQNEVIKKYRIDICDGTKCEDGDWGRTHAHPKKRRVCKWKQANSIVSTFDLLHEIGHIVNNNSRMRRCEEEYHATVWAIQVAKEYGIADKIGLHTRKNYQWYILDERDRGVRRGGANYPSKESLTLDWGDKKEEPAAELIRLPEKKYHVLHIDLENGWTLFRCKTPGSWSHSLSTPGIAVFTEAEAEKAIQEAIAYDEKNLPACKQRFKYVLVEV